MNKSRNVFILVTILFLSIIFSYIILEDTLGGAKHDFTFHEKFVILFAEDFKNTFRDYGKGELLARNSPIFYIVLSFIYKSGIELDKIKYLNIISIPLLIYPFYSCLKIQFKNIDRNLLIFLSFIVLLSPTVRSLIVWPYPILYGFIFFLFSVKFYLEFANRKKIKLQNALKNTFYLALASYITPNFSVFVIFFLYKFFLEFKISKKFFYIVVLNCLLAIPAFIYYFINDFYFFEVTVREVGLNVKLNIFNKIVIILSLIFFYYIPFINRKLIKNLFNSLKELNRHYILILFFLISVYFFNFPIGNFGGGIFYHLSQFIFANNIIIFVVFFLAIFLFQEAKLINFNNLLIFLCLILYNLQVSIYHKYFDPLLLIIILCLISNNRIINNKIFIEITKKYYLLYLFFLGASFYKVIFF